MSTKIAKTVPASHRARAVLIAIALLCWTAVPAIAAQGFGASTSGGAAGEIVRVTNLNDSGAGSLRAAVASGNRHIVFDVAGTITLTSEITIRHAFVTLDGLSAPSPGITLKNAGVVVRGPGHDVIVRGVRIRDARQDGIWVTDAAHNVLIEHVSVHNSRDGNIDITRDGTRDVTVAWSILAEPAGEEKNMLIAFWPTRVSAHHNLFIAAEQRNPQVTFDDTEARSQDTETTLDMRNNLLWNWRNGYATRIRYGARANVVNNYFAAVGGDARDALVVCRGLADDSKCYDDTTNIARAYVRGNVSADRVDIDREGTETTPFPAPAVDTESALAAACAVRDGAGVRPLDTLDTTYLSTVQLTCGTTPPGPPPPPPPPPPEPPANQIPVASAGAVQSAVVNQVVTFDGRASVDADGDPLTYEWTFGDGTPAAGAIVAHAYTAPGTYTVTLTVSDGEASASATTSVTVTQIPDTAQSFDDTFDRANAATPGANWAVIGGPIDIQGQELRAPTATGDRLAIARPLSGATQHASAEFVLRDTNVAQRVGVVVRYEDASNYYVAYRVNGGSSVLRIARVVNGLETVLGQKSIRNPTRNAWFRLGGRAEGQRLTLELDGVPIFSVTDSTFGQGGLGLLLGSKQKATVAADDFTGIAR
jgi:pectate lyase